MTINHSLTLDTLAKKLDKFWQLSGQKIKLIQTQYDHGKGSPVFTSEGKYTTRGWTEWTQGFEFGSSILQYDATGEKEFLKSGRENTVNKMTAHVGHFGVHDHGFNNVSTYGNLLRLMKEGKIAFNEWEKNFYELALGLSGMVQAKRWTKITNGGFIYSFNGPHSLFVDTIRSVRALMVSHELGNHLFEENDQRISLLERGIEHCLSTAKYCVFYGEGRDNYDVPGRTAHESVFNTNDGNFRCPNSQQGYTGFSTWTRGLSWAMLGFAEQLEYIQTVSENFFEPFGGKKEIEDIYIKAAKATCDFYIANTPSDGIPYWDTGAPQLHKLGDYINQNADPYNEFEPVDSSAATIAAQGLMRLGKHLNSDEYFNAGLTIMNALLEEPYLSTSSSHQGLILHSIYHQPNGWDYIPKGSKIPNGQSSMWGDYHAREAALYLQRLINNDTYYSFFGT